MTPTPATALARWTRGAMMALRLSFPLLCACTFPDVGYGGGTVTNATASWGGCTSAVAADCTCPDHCTLPNASASCSARICMVDACASPHADCNHDRADGCEADLHQDDLHCGSCDVACVPPKHCKGGKCK